MFEKSWLEVFGLSGFLDVAFMALLIYLILVWFKKTRAAFVLTGILIVAGMYLLTRLFNLIMTATMFEQFFAIILIAMVVIFQEELRNIFEKVAVWSLERRLTRRKVTQLTREETETLVRCLLDFSRQKHGSLIVLVGKDLLLRHLTGGVDLFGEMSEPILKSLFDPNSIGHDGAVVIKGNRIIQFSCHLPLSKNLKKVAWGGTRHAAALGLTELTDAMCLVVSEESGAISVAHRGAIHEVKDPDQLIKILEKFYHEVSPVRSKTVWKDVFKKNYREKIMALLLSLALWFVLVHGSKEIYRNFSVPIELGVLPQTWEVVELEPRVLEVTLRGPRRLFIFLTGDRIKFSPKIRLEPGVQKIRVYSNQIGFPKNIELESFDPKILKLHLEKMARVEELDEPDTSQAVGE